MSIKVMTHVWDGFPGAGSELLAMLALADWCDDRGGSLYPSIQAVADKVRVGEKHARNIMRKFEDERYLAVVGNHFGGKPGTTREYRLNVLKLKQLADDANAKKEAERVAKQSSQANGKTGKADWVDVFATPPLQVTPPSQVTPTPPLQVTPTPPPQFREGSPVVTETPPLQGGLSTIEPPMEPSVIPASPAAPPTVIEGDAVAKESAGKKAADKKAAADKTDELQAACRATWASYADAYAARYSTQPVRNAKVNSNVKDFVKRLGYDESPAVAAFFVKSINDVFVVRSCHPVGSLLQNAEAYRTQWATGRTAESLAAKVYPAKNPHKFAGAAAAIFNMNDSEVIDV